MARFTAMPVTIEAVIFTGITETGVEFEDPTAPEGTETPRWLLEAMVQLPNRIGSLWHEDNHPSVNDPLGQDRHLFVGTLNGPVRVNKGEWIIKGTMGDLYPCDPEAFASKYIEEGLMPGPADSFEADLASVINRWSVENGSNTPDFILAEFVADVLRCVSGFMTKREAWYGRRDRPGGVEGDRILYEKGFGPGDGDSHVIEAPLDAPEFANVEIKSVLREAADTFRKYQHHHEAKADEAASDASDAADSDQQEAAIAENQLRGDRAARNRRMADLCEAAIHTLDALPMPNLLALALQDAMRGAFLESSAHWLKVQFAEPEKAPALHELLSAAKIEAERA